MRDLALQSGIAETSLIIEDASRTTLENAVNAAAILSDNGWRKAVVVTDALHLPRSLMTFRGVGIRAHGRGAGRPWRGPFRSLWRFAVYEMCAFPWYVTQIAAGKHRRPRQFDAKN